MDNEQKDQVQTKVVSEQVPSTPQHLESANLPRESVFMGIKRITAWVMIISAVLFALIGIMGIWEVLGDNAGDVVWRAFSSLLVISFAALIVNVASRVGEGKH